MATITQEKLNEALEQRRDYVMGNKELTLKQFIFVLAEDLGVDKKDIKPFKEPILAFTDKVLNPPPPAAAAAAAEEEEEDEEANSASDSDSEEEEEEKPKKKRATKSTSTEKKAPRVYTKKVEKMRSLCRQATITVPPNIYSKNPTDKELESAFETLLSKHGLTADAGPREVAKTKEKIQLARDLEGIDTSNIISTEGRPSRRAAAAAQTNLNRYKDAVVNSDSEEEEDDDDDDEEASDASVSAEEQHSDDSEKADGEEKGEDAESAPAAAEKKKEEKKEEPKSAEKKKASPSPKRKADEIVTENLSPAKADNQENEELIPAKKAPKLADWSDDE